jgi:hypothetical protein
MGLTWREIGVLSDAANLDDCADESEIKLFPETVEEVEEEELRQAAEDVGRDN